MLPSVTSFLKFLKQATSSCCGAWQPLFHPSASPSQGSAGLPFLCCPSLSQLPSSFLSSGSSSPAGLLHPDLSPAPSWGQHQALPAPRISDELICPPCLSSSVPSSFSGLPLPWSFPSAFHHCTEIPEATNFISRKGLPGSRFWRLKPRVRQPHPSGLW